MDRNPKRRMKPTCSQATDPTDFERPKMTTYYLSKYALSTGIKLVDAPEAQTGDYVMPVGFCNSYRVGTSIHRTEAEAASVANAQLIKKIKSLKAQITKLEKIKFEVSAP